MKNRLIETGTEFGNTSCVPKSRGNGIISVSPLRRTQSSIQAEIELTKRLLELVNTQEEYEYLERELAELQGLVPLVSSSSLKGGAALTCR